MGQPGRDQEANRTGLGLSPRAWGNFRSLFWGNVLQSLEWVLTHSNIGLFSKAGQRRDNVWFSSSTTPHQHVVSSQDSLDIPWTLGPPQAKTLRPFLTSSSSPCPAVVSSLTSAHPLPAPWTSIYLPTLHSTSAGSPDRAPSSCPAQGWPCSTRNSDLSWIPPPCSCSALPQAPPPASASTSSRVTGLHGIPARS